MLGKASTVGVGPRALQTMWSVLAVLLLAALVAGLYARLDGLGTRPLAEDEYYTVRSVEFILERGGPEFPSGGYYVRGPILQYVMAGSALLFGENELSYRLPIVLFSLCSIALAYLYTRRFAPLPVAAAVALVLLVSSWHIEFGRFARMYALLQCLTLLYLITLHDAFFRARWRRRYLPHLVAGLATLSHALGLLLTPLLFLPLLGITRLRFPSLSHRLRYAAVSLATLLACLGFVRSGLRNLGVVDRLPEGYQFPEMLSQDTLMLPILPFWQLEGDPWTSFFLLGALAGAVVALLWVRQRRGHDVRATDVLLTLLLISSLSHQFILCIVLVLILFLRYDLYRLDQHPRRPYALLLLAALIGAGWFIFALSAPARLADPAIAARWWDMTDHAFLKALWSTFLGWPDVYRGTLRPFYGELLVVGAFAAAALGYTMIRLRHAPLPVLASHPAFILVYMVVIYGILRSDLSRVRYWFHLYPVIICLIALALHDAAARFRPALIPTKPAHARWLAALGLLAAFALTSDFNPRHLFHAGADHVGLRLGEFEEFQRTWYPRRDVATPARFVNREAHDPATRIIVEDTQAVSYYVEPEHAVYFDRGTKPFNLVARARGTVDAWSDMRLLSTPAELADYTARAREVWLIRQTERPTYLPEPAEVWGERLLEQSQAYLSRDGRIEVVHIKLAPSQDCSSVSSPGRPGRAGDQSSERCQPRTTQQRNPRSPTASEQEAVPPQAG